MFDNTIRISFIFPIAIFNFCLYLSILFMLKTSSGKYMYFKSLIMTQIFSLYITINLGVNYAISLNSNDGLSIHSIFASMLLSDNDWSHASYKQCFASSIIVSLFIVTLLFYYFLKNKKKNK